MLFLVLDILLCSDKNIQVLQRQSKHNCLLSHFVSTYTAAAETCNSVYRNKVIVELFLPLNTYMFLYYEGKSESKFPYFIATK